MSIRLAIALSILGILPACDSQNRQSSEPVTTRSSVVNQIADYHTSDPNLEPTLRVGKYLEVRTKDGSPVVLKSQVDDQRRAAEQQRETQTQNTSQK